MFTKSDDANRKGRGDAYRPDIDGLRAVAIAPVLCFHAGFGCTGGFVGVDVFFVISGFLITSVIRNELERGTFSLLTFWERRVRRLFPALAVNIAATLAVGYVLLLPADYRELGQSVVAQTLLSANFYFWRETGYFEGPSEIKPLLHLWSLAVEEQFYLLLPPLLLLVARRRFRDFALLGLLVASFVWSVRSVREEPSAAFFLLPSRAWELLLGVVLAYRYERLRVPRVVSGPMAGLGLSLIVVSCFAYSRNTPFPGWAATLPCLGTAAIIATGGRGHATLVERILSTRPFVVIGWLSYSLYLWHWPIFAFANYLKFDELSLGMRLTLATVSVAAAALSWAFVEQPVRRRAVLAPRRRLFVAAACMMSLLLVAGVVLHERNGLRGRFAEDILRAADAAKDRNPQHNLRHQRPLREIEAWMPRVGDPKDARPPVLGIFGDSHADALYPVIEALCREFDVPAATTSRNSTYPLAFNEQDSTPLMKRFQAAVHRFLADEPSVQHVFFVARWGMTKDEPATRERLRRDVESVVRLGKTVWLLRDVPEQRASVPRALALSKRWRCDFTAATLPRSDYLEYRAGIDGFLTELAGDRVFVIDPIDFFYPDGETCRVTWDDRPLYFDDDHISAFGAMQMRPLLLPIFEAIAAERQHALTESATEAAGAESFGPSEGN